MTGLTNLAAKQLLMRVIGEAERMMGLEEGAVLSERRHRPVVRARQVCMLIGVEELKLTTTPLGRFMRRDHSTVIWGARAARRLITGEPWQGLHAHLVDLVRAGPLPPPPVTMAPAPAVEPPEGRSGPTPEPAAEMSGAVAVGPGLCGSDDVWPGRDWFERNDRVFVAEMRRVHPEREVVDFAHAGCSAPAARAGSAGAPQCGGSQSRPDDVSRAPGRTVA